MIGVYDRMGKERKGWDRWDKRKGRHATLRYAIAINLKEAREEKRKGGKRIKGKEDGIGRNRRGRGKGQGEGKMGERGGEKRERREKRGLEYSKEEGFY